jgi:hypothetical protein
VRAGRRGIGQVNLYWQRIDSARELAGRSFTAEIRERRCETASGEFFHDGPTDALGAAGYQGYSFVRHRTQRIR